MTQSAKDILRNQYERTPPKKKRRTKMSVENWDKLVEKIKPTKPLNEVTHAAIPK